MAFAVKYRCPFYDFQNQRQSKVDILEDGFVGDITTLTGADNPFNIQYNEADWVIGSEVIFRFVADQSEVATFDSEFLAAAYKAKKLKYYPDGTNIEFTGWLKPENATRQYHSYRPIYTLSATDGIADLKEIDYYNAGVVYSDAVSLLTTIKRALSLIGITDNDFFIQCNTYETTLMTSTQDPFIEIDHDSRRFYSVEDGETRPMKAYEVLESVVKPFYCRLFQRAGYWYIVNDQEYNSYRTLYNWSDLSVKTARDVSDRSLDINAYLPHDSEWELTKIAPIKKQRIVFKNKNLGGNELTNGDFSTGDTTGWTNSGFETFTNPSNYLRTIETNSSDPYFQQSATFGITATGENDNLNIRAKVKAESLVFTSGASAPFVKVQIVSGATVLTLLTYRLVQGTWIDLNCNYLHVVSGDYNIRFQLEEDDPLTYCEIHWDNIRVVHNETVNTTFDQVFIFENDAEGYREEEQDVLFGDSAQNTDVGALNDGGTNTSTWSRYDKGESSALIPLLGQQIINDNQGFMDRLHVEILDTGNNINFGIIALYNSKYYKFLNFSKDYSENKISGDLIQINNSEATVTTTIQPLTSSDGEGSGVESALTIQPSYWIPTASGIYTGQNVGIGMAPTGTYDFEVAVDAWIGNDLTVANDLFVTGDLQVTGTITGTYAVAFDDLTDVTFGGTSVAIGGDVSIGGAFSVVDPVVIGDQDDAYPPDKDAGDNWYVWGWNGTQWAAMPVYLRDLIDVDYDSGDVPLTNDYVLKYKTATNKWTPEVNGATVATLAAVDDVNDYVDIDENHILYYSGTAWQNVHVDTFLSNYSKLADNETITGGWTFNNNITMQDGRYIGNANAQIEFGNGAMGDETTDLSLYAGTGGEIYIYAGGVWLGTFYDSGINLLDNMYINLGSGNDSLLYFNGTNTIFNLVAGNLQVQDNGTTHLKYADRNLALYSANPSDTTFHFYDGLVGAEATSDAFYFEHDTSANLFSLWCKTAAASNVQFLRITNGATPYMGIGGAGDASKVVKFTGDVQVTGGLTVGTPPWPTTFAALTDVSLSPNPLTVAQDGHIFYYIHGTGIRNIAVDSLLSGYTKNINDEVISGTWTFTKRAQFAGNVAPATDAGVEIGEDGSSGCIISYDRDSTAFYPLFFNMLSLDVYYSNTKKIDTDATSWLMVDSYRLDFGDGNDFRLQWNGTNMLMDMYGNGDLLLRANTTTEFTFDLYTTYVGTLTCANVAGDSDERLKENINQFSPPSEEVEKLRKLLRVFNWKKSGREDIGMVAQEVERECPILSKYLVKTDKEGYKSIFYDKLVLMLAI